MKEKEELELILKLIGKYNLPLSPILEYAVKEKMEEYPEMDTTSSSDVVSESTAIGVSTMVSDSEEPCDDFTIKNTLNRCFIINQFGEKVFSATGKLIYINKKMYQLNINTECFTLKSMIHKGGLWENGKIIIVALPDTELYNVMDYSLDYAYEIEDIVDSTVFENCRLKVDGFWFNCNGILDLNYSV